MNKVPTSSDFDKFVTSFHQYVITMESICNQNLTSFAARANQQLRTYSYNHCLFF